jgi:hypothetical protein
VTSSLACYFVLSSPAGSLQIDCDVALLGLVLDSRLYVLEPLVMLLLPAVLGVAVVWFKCCHPTPVVEDCCWVLGLQVACCCLPVEGINEGEALSPKI